MRLLFYTSGHGYGHATRQAAVIEALARRVQGVQVLVRGTAPAFAWDGVAIERSEVRMDVGVIEKDPFHQDAAATFDAYRALDFERLASEEAAFVRAHSVDLIVSDIPPLASVIGTRAGVRTCAIGNFSWDEIYASFAGFEEVVAEMRAQYALTDLLLRVPFHLRMDAFRRRIDIPLIARHPRRGRKQTRQQLGLDGSRIVVLAALRGQDAVHLKGSRLQVIPPSVEGVWFPDLVAAADVVVSKPGYGIVTECLAAQTPLLFLQRHDFAEYPVIVSELKHLMPCLLLDNHHFDSGHWEPAINRLLQQPAEWANVRLDGAAVAAEILADL